MIVRDVFGKPTSITRGDSSKSVTRRYVYDSAQRLCKTIEPESGATVQEYDGADNVLWRASGLALPSTTSCDTASVPAASKITYQYDARNRSTGSTYGDNSPAVPVTLTPDGLPNTVSSNGAIWTNTYNKRRLLERESLAYGGATYNIGRSYDANGSLAQLTYPDNTSVAYNPNALGEPRQVGAYANAILYHPNGGIASFNYGNTTTGIKHSTTQNERGLPLRSTDLGGVRDDQYGYDASGNVTSIDDLLPSNVSKRAMTYDGLDRLKTVTAPNMWGTATYGYDALDNLTSTTITGGISARNTLHNINATTNRLDSITNSPPGSNAALVTKCAFFDTDSA
jgi:YD repeat-containing protein